GHVVSDGRGADASLGADHRDDAADRLRLRGRVQGADGAHHVDDGHRGDDVFADATPHEFAVEHDVVDTAEDNDARAGVADASEFFEAAENIAAPVGLEHDNVRGRRVFVGLDRGNDAAHLDLEVSLAKTAVFTGRLDRSGGFDGVAERLHG